MKKILLLTLALFGLCLPGGSRGAETNLTFSKEYLAQIVRHLYRWHLDETALLALDESPQIDFWIREVTPELDAADRSRYVEILVPRLSYRLLLKRADYEVPEMALRIENKGFRVLRTEKYTEPPAAPEAFQVIQLPKRETVEYLFATRNQADYPDEAMRERMRQALREQLGPASSQEAQTFYLAPLSPVSNDLWVFWESGGKLIRFSSDTDLTSKAYWAYEKLGVRVYDLKENIVVSLTEAAGSNAYVTRDWAARALFNCIVFGQRLLITPQADPTQPLHVQEAPAGINSKNSK